MILEKMFRVNHLKWDSKEDKALSFSILPKLINSLLWILFIGNLFYLVFFYPNIPEWKAGNLLKVNGFTVLIWSTVNFFSAIISSYASSYLYGFKYYYRFVILCLSFTLSVMLFVMSNHVVLLLLSWLTMGFLISRLIGIDSRWGEAKEASKFALRNFLAGSFFLTAGIMILAFSSGVFTVDNLMASLTELPSHIIIIAALCMIVAAIIQSAIFPFHRWLLSAMTAPTPASALMHAGFVNGAGILLTIFSALIFASNTWDILLIVGGLTAIIAQFTKLLQVNVKQRLACSTIAQMGFMIMQCGLGFFNAAVAHLILHGFYKAYLFLNSGEEIAHSSPQKAPQIKITATQAVVVGSFGFIGAMLFALSTGKGIHLDSGFFLTLIVAITIGQITYNIVKQQSLSVVQKAILPPVLFITGIAAYTALYHSVTALMVDIPMATASRPLSIIQMIFGLVFLIGFFIMKLGIYRKIPWLYVKLLNLSQPYKKSILMFKTNS